MVQNDIHRPHVLTPRESGKTKDTRWFLGSLLVVVQGCGRKIFFACSGNGNGTSWNNRGSNGNYWSSSLNSATNGRNLNFNSGGVNPQNNNNRFNGFAVRAVQHTLLIILFFMIYGTDTEAASTRSVSGILRCEETQVCSELCQKMGSELEAEYGRLMRRFVSSSVRSTTIEMLHCGLSEEKGNLRCHVQRPHSTSSVLQLYSWSVREDFYSRYLFLHQESWNSLWHRPYNGFLSQGKSELATCVLCHALGYKRLFHAYCQEEAFGNSYFYAQENVFTQNQQRLSEYVERCLGYGLSDMAYRDYCHAESEGELCYCWRSFELDWLGSGKESASCSRRSWFANRQSDFSVIQQCISERIRPIHEESHEMSLLWQICGRCSRCVFGQRVLAILSAEDSLFPKIRIRIGFAHGQVGDNRSASRSRVLRCFHQAVQNIYFKSCLAENNQKDLGVRFLEALESHKVCEQLLGHIQAYCFLQSFSQAIDDKEHSENRHIRQRYDQDNRQIFIL